MIAALTFYAFSTITLLSASMVIAARNPVHSVFFLILTFCSAAGLFVLMGAEFLAMALIVVYVGAVAVLFLFVVMMLDIPLPLRVRTKLSALRGFGKSLAHLVAYGAGFLISFAVAFTGLFYSLHKTALSFTLPDPFSLDTLFPTSQQLVLFISVLSPLEKGIILAHCLLALVLARYVATLIIRTTLTEILARINHWVSFGFLALAFLCANLFSMLTEITPLNLSKDLLSTPRASLPLTNTQALGKLLYTDYVYTFQSAGFLLLVAIIGAIVLTQRKRTDYKRQDARAQIARQRAEAVELRTPETGQGTS